MRLLAAGFLKTLHPRCDDDFVDKLNYYYTPFILVISATVVSTKQYISKPIQCWIPSHFTASMQDYIEQYCWLQNTYWLPMHENIPDDHHVRDSRQIGYYQWVHFMLIIEALLFALPCLVWRLSNWRSGLNLHYLVAAACDVHAIDGSEKCRALSEIAANLRSVLELQSGVAKSVQQLAENKDANGNFSRSFTLRRLRCCQYSGSYVTAMYLCTKFIYAINVLAQFFLLNAFLKNDDVHMYGIRVLSDVIYGRQWTESGHFPRVTLCDFEVRSLGNLNRFTVQCALIANIFNEKVFVFVWIWTAALALITFFSFLFWFFNLAFLTQRAAFVMTYLRIASAQCASTNSSGTRRSSIYCLPVVFYDRFIDNYLGADGIFALRMIANHAGDVVTLEIIKRLWTVHRNACDAEAVFSASDNGLSKTPFTFT